MRVLYTNTERFISQYTCISKFSTKIYHIYIYITYSHHHPALLVIPLWIWICSFSSVFSCGIWKAGISVHDILIEHKGRNLIRTTSFYIYFFCYINTAVNSLAFNISNKLPWIILMFFWSCSSEVSWGINHKIKYHHLMVYCGQQVLFIMGL